MLIQADSRTLPLADGCVSCVVTSPPYWGLRDYGTGQWSGGDPSCDHRKPFADVGHIAHSTLDGGKLTNAAQVGGYKSECGRCGALRIDAQIGLESTPDAYVAQLVAVFREVRRVLADDGTVWLNLGDSYNSAFGEGQGPRRPGSDTRKQTAGRLRGLLQDLKPKDLVGIPWRVAFALQADGWYLRSDIIWSKPNPMPESVTDRPTKAHEYIFLLSKAARYYYDADAVREVGAESTLRDKREGRNRWQNGGGSKESLSGDSSQGFGTMAYPADQKRNKRSVWTVTTQPYPDAHFATFPEALIEPCILAGCPVGGRVLDPFIGSGTTGAVAERLGRRWVGVDLTYHHLARARTAQRGLMWA